MRISRGIMLKTRDRCPCYGMHLNENNLN